MSSAMGSTLENSFKEGVINCVKEDWELIIGFNYMQDISDLNKNGFGEMAELGVGACLEWVQVRIVQELELARYRQLFQGVYFKWD